MRNRAICRLVYRFAFAALTAFVSRGDANALPDFYNAVAVADDTAVFSVYRDASDQHQYWVPYSAISVANDDKGFARFSVVHWGITDFDIDGAGATVSFTAAPDVYATKYKSLTDTIKASDPKAKFSLLPVVDSYYELLMDSRFVFGTTASLQRSLQASATDSSAMTMVTEDGQKDPQISIKDAHTSFLAPNSKAIETLRAGAGGAPQAFVLELSRLGGRVLASSQGAGGGALVLRYKYKVMGVGPRLHARITVDWNRLVQSFQADASGSFYNGAITSAHRLAYKKLQETGAVKLEVLSGGATQEEALDAYVKELYELLTKAYINGTGLFEPELTTIGPMSTPKGSETQSFQWKISVSTFAEQLEEQKTSIFEIDKKDMVPQWFSVGFSVGNSCKLGSGQFVNITKADRPCITSETIAEFHKRLQACLIDAHASVEKLKAGGVPSDEMELIRETFVEACRR